MAIERKFGKTTSSEALEEGEHVVTITDIKFGKSKANKPMWTLTYSDHEGRSIRGYYVPEVKFHLQQLKEVKTACGLSSDATPDQLMGKKLGIAVEPQEPTPDGMIFMRITGYGKASLVEAPPKTEQTSFLSPTVPAHMTEHVDEIPF